MRKFARVNTTALDAANYILFLAGQDGVALDPVTLQKILYFAQCWSLRDGNRLFDNDVEAWKHGPVVREVYKAYSGSSPIRPLESLFYELTAEQMDLIHAVWTTLKGSQGASVARTVHDDPSSAWSKARAGLPMTADSDRPLAPEDMATDAQRIEAAASKRLSQVWDDAARCER